MSKNGLNKWFKQKWVDIGSKKKGGGFKECGRKSASGSKRKYPKVRPCCKSRPNDRIAKAFCCCEEKK